MRKHTQSLCYCALLCALMIVSTLFFRFTIPGTDVMVTLQTLFVLLCGQLLPVKHCLYTTGAYLLAGLIGLPVFSAVSGPAVVVTPSFGYLIAFPFAAAVTSVVRLHSKKGNRYTASFFGVLIMYLVAAAYLLVLSVVYLTELSFKTILLNYMLIFLPLDLVKGFLAAWLGHRMHKLTLSLR